MSNTIDTCQTGYDYEQFQLNELENENMKLKEQLIEANKLIKDFHKMHEFNKSAIEYLKKWSVK